jgi:hypothetical protein
MIVAIRCSVQGEEFVESTPMETPSPNISHRIESQIQINNDSASKSARVAHCQSTLRVIR